MLARAQVYRAIELRQLWLGLEPLDAVGVGFVGWFFVTFNGAAHGWNLLAVLLVYLLARLFKVGKPAGYTQALLRFYVMRPPFLSAAAADRKAAAHPFPFTPNQGDCR